MPTNKSRKANSRKSASRKEKSRKSRKGTSREKRKTRTRKEKTRRGPIVVEHKQPIQIDFDRHARAPIPTSLTPSELEKVSIGQLSQIAQEFGIQIGGLTLDQVINRIISYQ